MRQESMEDLQQGTMGQNQTEAAAAPSLMLLEITKHAAW